jgi:hypothetical protein
MAWNDKDEMLDDLWDHVFPEDGGEPDDQDKEWFAHLASFFDQLDEKPSGDGGSGGTNAPRRRRRPDTTNKPRRRRAATGSGSGSYNRAFFGSPNS